MKTRDSLRVISPGLAEFQASLRSHPCNSSKHKGCNKHGEFPLLSLVWLESVLPALSILKISPKQSQQFSWDETCGTMLGGPQLEVAFGSAFGDGWWLICTNNCFGHGGENLQCCLLFPAGRTGAVGVKRSVFSVLPL